MSLRLGRKWHVLALVLVGYAIPALGDPPAARYSVISGTVKDQRTGLTWQQAVDSTSYSWADAQTYCQGLTLAGMGWRLPALKELLTLVDPTRSQPAIDTTVFPNTPSDWFWTASTYVGSPGDAWYVSFINGNTNDFAVSGPYRVRCVRSTSP